MFGFFNTEKLISSAIIMGVFLLLFLVWTLIAVPVVIKISTRLKANWICTIIKSFKKPVSIILIVSGAIFALTNMMLQTAAIYITIYAIYRVFLVYCVAWGLISAKGIVKDLLLRQDNARNETVVLFLTRIYTVVIAIFAVLMALSELSFDVTGILTGLGLGSLTIALAAQDAASNFFGGFIIILERPFEVGDWITADVIEGGVEDITFRSTKIRTIDGSLTVVPNNKLAGGALTNWTKLNHRLLRFNLGLTYNTKKAVIEQVAGDVNKMLKEHDDIEKDTIEVCLNEFASSSIDLFVTCYVKHPDIKLYRECLDNINYKIMDIMEKNNASFAFPSQSIYFENPLNITK